MRDLDRLYDIVADAEVVLNTLDDMEANYWDVLDEADAVEMWLALRTRMKKKVLDTHEHITDIEGKV